MDKIVWEKKEVTEDGFFIKEFPGGFELWEYPRYGGEPRYVQDSIDLEKLKKIAESYC